MTDGVFFNIGGKTHSMRILSVDSKFGETSIYEMLVDNEVYVPFECREEAETWEIIAEATRSYVDFLLDDTVKSRTFKDGRFVKEED